jgi:hypothetical protein
VTRTAIAWTFQKSSRLLCAPFPFGNRAGSEPAEFGGIGVELLGMIGAPRLECGEPAAEAGGSLATASAISSTFMAQYSTAEA